MDSGCLGVSRFYSTMETWVEEITPEECVAIPSDVPGVPQVCDSGEHAGCTVRRLEVV